MIIKVKPNISDVNKILGAIQKEKALFNNLDCFVRQEAQKFVQDIRQNIDEQLYGDFGVPHSEKWKKHKEKIKQNPEKYWYYLGRLYKAVRFIQIRKNVWWSGITSDYNSASDDDPKEYGIILETGGSDPSKARPLFSRTIKDFGPKFSSASITLEGKIKVIWK